MINLWQDIKFGMRLLRKNWGFTVLAVLTLGLGIGANAALFSVVNGVLLNPLPFPDPQSLVAIYSSTSALSRISFSYPNFLDWQKNSQSFAQMAVYRSLEHSLSQSTASERLHGEMVSAEFFQVLGVNPIIGRAFSPEDDRIGAGPVVMIGEGLFKRRFGSSSSVLGTRIILEGEGYTIIGVATSNISVLDPVPVDIYSPIGQWKDSNFRDRKISMGIGGLGRLKRVVTIEQARTDMSSVARHLSEIYPEANSDTGIKLVSLKQDIVGDVQTTLIILLGAVGFVLLIACANVANLVMARSAARVREFAIRTALGASRTRFLLQLFIENVILAFCGAVLGLLIARVATEVILTSIPTALPRADNIRLDWTVLAFTLLISVACAVLFGVLPALKTREDNICDALKDRGAGAGGSHRKSQSIIVVTELALSIVLLTGAGLMIRTMNALWDVNLGFDPRNVLTFTLNLAPERLANPAVSRESFRNIKSEINAVPGIQSMAAVLGSLPMQGASDLPFWVEGRPKPTSASDTPSALWCAVQPDYFGVMKIDLLRGRSFSTSDEDKYLPVILVDEEFVRKYLAGEEPIGQRINLPLLEIRAEIVGIVRHVEHWGLGDSSHQDFGAHLYTPLAQMPDKLIPLAINGLTIVARTDASPEHFEAAIRSATLQNDPSQIVYDFVTMDRIVSNSVGSKRLTMIILNVFSIFALILSAVGIYGLISYVVSLRTSEIGIRMAIGARQWDILRMIMGEGVRLILVGVVLGVLVALLTTRAMGTLLYGVKTNDPLTFFVVATVLTLVAVVACYVPAHRAMSVDPSVAFRYE